MTRSRERYLREIGIRSGSGAALSLRPAVATSVGFTDDATAIPAGRADERWSALAAAVRACTLCPLHATRTQTVSASGGESAIARDRRAPGADEDRQGEPFVGRAGQLLNAMLHAIGYERAAVYIANILKCRPPNNRDPRPEEASCCTPYLDQQIGSIAPRVILAVGQSPGNRCCSRMHPSVGCGQGLSLRPVSHAVGVTYHPAYCCAAPRQGHGLADLAWSKIY